MTTAAFAADTGKITGSIVDKADGEPMIGVSVYVVGTEKGAITDLDGSFTIRNLDPGSYNLKVQMVGYQTITVDSIQVVAGEENRLNFQMASKTEQLKDEIKVTAKAVQNTEAVMLKHRQGAKQVTDAISSEEISKSGSGDAAEAMKKVVGASVMEDIVYVRGLGDRYALSQLNGSLMPSPDLERQAVPMDMISSDLLDNIVVTKTFTPDKPGHFSGGAVDLRTKDFPETRKLSFSASSSYNSLTTFDDDYMSFNHGFDNVPSVWDDPATQAAGAGFRGFIRVTDDKTLEEARAQADQLAAAGQEFSTSDLRQVADNGPLNRSYSGSYGDVHQVFGRKLGINTNFSYDESFSFYDDGVDAKFARRGTDTEEMTIQHFLHDTKSVAEELFGGLANISYSLHANHKIGATYIYNRSNSATTRFLEGGAPETFSSQGNDTTSARLESWVFQVKERTLHSLQFKGDHALFRLNEEADPFKLNWRVSRSDARQYLPDQRFFTQKVDFLNDDGEPTDEPQAFIVDETDADILPTRYFRDANEDNTEFGADFEIPTSQKLTFKAGFARVEKDRTHEQRRFVYHGPRQYSGVPQDYVDSVGSYNPFVRPDNGDTTRFDFKYYLREETVPEDQYDGFQDITGYYGMFEYRVLNPLTIIAGARYEETEMFAQNGFEPGDPQGLYDSGEISESDLLPSVNFIYNLSDEMNVRAAYGRTLARPTIREFAPFASQDFGASGKVFNGNPDLERTLIDNIDLRWEWFIRPGEVFAISTFYKYFDKPIEMAILDTNEGQIGPVNVPEAEVIGVEIEARRRLDHVAPFLSNFDLGVNVTLVESRVDIPESELIQLRAFNPDADDTRQMFGQAPYIVNVSLGYSNFDRGTSVTLQYNRVGERFAVNAPGGTPDVYEQPRDMFDIIASQTLLGSFKLKFSAKNIFDEVHEEIYQDTDNLYRRYGTGRSFGLGLTWNLY